jgi:hypothetical protein
MQTKTQLNNKKAELEQWLRDNPTHANRIEVQRDLRNIIDKLIDKNTK